MPVEDATVAWDEAASPYRTVGRSTVAPQASIGTELARVTDEETFSPWHGLAAHRPLGAVNRARHEAYEMSSGFRASFNRCSMHDSPTR